MGALIGGRLSDSIFSHLRFFKKYAPNPGLRSIPYYYYFEVIWLTVLFLSPLRDNLLWNCGGFAVGFLGFLVILPLLLRLFRNPQALAARKTQTVKPALKAFSKRKAAPVLRRCSCTTAEKNQSKCLLFWKRRL